MRSRFALSAATLVVAGLLSACGGNGDPPTPPRFEMSVLKTEDVPGTFGAVGAYEKLTGQFKGEVDPNDPKNAIITDLQLAPRNANGKVDYTADFVLFKPKDMSKANGVLRFDVPNRGRLVNLDAHFAARGYVFLNSAWQADVPAVNGQLTLAAPVARNLDGSTITGTYRTELLPATATTNSLALPGGAYNSGAVPYEPASLDNTLPGYSLTRRVNQADPKEPIPSSDWKFAKCDSATPFPGAPDPKQVCVKGGVDPNYIYELIYVAKNPIVMGVGLAAVRDAMTFFASATADARGAANPVAGAIRHTIASGVSQSGNFTKTFIHLGFNERLRGGKVFDGAFAQLAARQTNINARFAIPGGGGGVRTDHDAFGQGGARGLAADYFDDVSQRSGGIFQRCEATGTCPKLFVGYSGTEFWTLQGSPLLTDALGTRDLAQPANARVYYYASSHHLPGLPALTGAQAAQFFGISAAAKYSTNGNLGIVPVIRALYQNLEEWVVAGVTPPDSEVPRVADRTLVQAGQVNFPAIPGVTYTGLVNTMHLFDWGPDYRPRDESGIATVIPPRNLGKDYAILVPQVDADGNDVAGIRSVDIVAPVATETGWNLTSRPGIVDQAFLLGSRFPLAKTQAERLANGDPRLSLEERYGNKAGYVAAVTAAANALVAKRYLLRADADAAISAAQASTLLP